MKLPPSVISSQVYFAKDVGGHVKIGWSANVSARFSQLQTCNPVPLYLMRVIDGGVATEAWLHRRFKNSRTHGEWFLFDPDMLTVVPPDEIPIPQKTTIRRDVRLTVRESLASIDASFGDFPDGDKLFLLLQKMNAEQRSEILAVIRSHVAPQERAVA